LPFFFATPLVAWPIVPRNAQQKGHTMYYEDREPNFFQKLWLCLYHYWND
jgi:hypothetical protein